MKNEVVIISIGRELLTGRTLDTNSNYLAKNITALGVRVSSIHTVDDVLKEIVREIRWVIRSKPAVIITTGGLGPTADDMTLQAVAKALNRRLVKNKKALSMLEARYNELYAKGLLHTQGWNEGRIKMGIMPSGSKPLKNPVGTAPAVFLKEGNTVIFCIPGVPAEAKAIFEMYITDWIKHNISTGYWVERSILTKSYDESVLRTLIDRVSSAFPDVYIKSSPAGFLKEKSLEVFFSATGKDEARVRERVNMAVDMLNQLMDQK
ncbi:MAG: competence/damage-inducible protein A [bacterium]